VNFAGGLLKISAIINRILWLDENYDGWQNNACRTKKNGSPEFHTIIIIIIIIFVR
jgi:hypothetical protein